MVKTSIASLQPSVRVAASRTLKLLWQRSPLSRVVVGVVDIDAQAARDSTAGDTW